MKHTNHRLRDYLSLALSCCLAGGCAVGMPLQEDDTSDASTSTPASPASGRAWDDASEPDGDADTASGPDGGVKGPANAATSADSGAADSRSPAVSACPGYASPTEGAQCKACSDGGAACQPNGCYGGYYCKLATAKCAQKPSGC